MTQKDHRQQTDPGDVSNLPRDVSTNPPTSLKPTTESISDNDTSEKPVREKLKKTSLASMSSHIVGRQERKSKENEETSAPDHIHNDSSPERLTKKIDVEPRGRPVKKRSFDDLDTLEIEGSEGAREHVEKLNANGHLRKRSKDVRASEVPKDNRRPLLAEIAVREEVEDIANGVESKEACFNGSKTTVESSTPTNEILSQGEIEQAKQIQQVMNESVKSDSDTVQRDDVPELANESADQEMRDSASSPRKKRIRDQFDTEADREQKIPATEEARAHRRSDEFERSAHSVVRNISPVSPKGSEVAEREPVTEEEQWGLHDANVGVERLERPSTFGSATTLSSLTFARSTSSAKISTFAPTATDQASQMPADAFAASGFAALAASSTSLFGTLGGSSTAHSASPFASAGVFNPEKTESNKKEAYNCEIAANGGSGAFVNSSSTNFGTSVESPFGTSGSSKAGVFGGSVLGSAFGGPFGGGNRLTTFAAPSGNAKLGASNGAIKPIGSPKHDGDEDYNSESDGEVSAENKKEDESGEADGRFQHQDVETGEGGEESIFSSRASLYTFRDNAWKESGKGIFKLNITAASSEEASSDQKTGRFIMRAHQTYRVLLNVPVFKQMQIGDSKGNEPSGKSFSFAVIESAKPVAHMVKLGDVTDSKTLYHEVKRLQNDLE